VLNKIVSGDRIKVQCVAKHRTESSAVITVKCVHLARCVKHGSTALCVCLTVATFCWQHKRTDQHKATKVNSCAMDIYSDLQSNS
jgi:hypothetical protein